MRTGRPSTFGKTEGSLPRHPEQNWGQVPAMCRAQIGCARNVVRREKARSLSGLEPTRQLSLQPVAIAAVVEETKRPKPSV